SPSSISLSSTYTTLFRTQARIIGILRCLDEPVALNGIGHLGRVQSHGIRAVIKWVWPEPRITAVVSRGIEARCRIDNRLAGGLLSPVAWIIQNAKKLEAILYRCLGGFQQGNFFCRSKTHIGTGLKADPVSRGI